MAKSFGVLASINPDAHSIREFEFLKNGIIVARRAGLRIYDVLNARPLNEIQQWLIKRLTKNVS